MIIVDAHEDLAFNALEYGRDYMRSALATRQAEVGSAAKARNGDCMLGLTEWYLGRVAVVFATIFSAPKRRASPGDREVYADVAEAHRGYSRELDYYHRLVDEHAQFNLIGTRGDLETVLGSWADPLDIARRRIGLVPLMEGADGIREPREVEAWMERGIRMIGLSWTGTRYAGGTGEPGPLTDDGRELLEAMSGLGLMLDLSHASEQSYFESLDRFEGTVLASHANPRALCEPRNPERNLTDDQIRALAERGGVMGIVPYNGFLRTGWTKSDGKGAVTLRDVATAIDHVCQVTGSNSHVGIGSDFDGGFGAESAPAELDTVADLMLLEGALAQRGYAPPDIEAVLGGNWLALLRRGLP
jgi:membrane dipeptidase